MKDKGLFNREEPAVPLRGVHLDLKGLAPTPQRLNELLAVIAAAQYNIVLAEWEDTFPWSVDKRFRSPTAYTEEDIRTFRETAQQLGLEIIPLIQCLGHMETPLSVEGYEHLREVPDDSSVLNPLADGAGELVQSMVDDVLRLMPNITYFHLGGDEAWTFGTHPDTAAYIKKHGKGELYLQHVEPVLDNLNGRGVRPLLWHDMMIEWEDEELASLGRKCDLVTWGYSGHPDTTDHHFNTTYIERFHANNINLWGAAAYKGADGHNVDLPNIQNRRENALGWVDIAKRFGYKGVFATAWSRYSTDRVQCEPIDAALDSLVNIGVVFHNGSLPEGDIKNCLSLLDELGEKERFEACRQSMERLTSARKRGWKTIQSLREQKVLCRRNERKTGSGIEQKLCEDLQDTVKQADNISREVKKSFNGLVDPMWIDEYLNTRLQPLEEELSILNTPGTA